MKNLFRWDNPLIQLLTALADVILTNLLCLICCLPVVTAGASIAATYKVMLNLSQDTGGGIWNTFFTAFRENFKQATAVWLITLLVGASLSLGADSLGRGLGQRLRLLRGKAHPGQHQQHHQGRRQHQRSAPP